MIKNAEAGPVESVLRMGFLQKIDSLNPYVGLNDASYIFYGLVYDALTVLDNKMNTTPDLATGVWAVPTSDPKMVLSGEPYGSVWQYNLTHNANWSDGEPFTAEDVKFNIEMNAENYTNMWSYQPYSYFMKSAEVIDQYTVRIHFYDRATGDSEPCAYAYLLSIPMLPKHKLESLSNSYIAFDWTGYFENEDVPIVCTGPFVATKTIGSDWINGDNITLTRNPDCHWSTDYGKTIQFDQLKMVFYDDSTAMSLALKEGDLDVAALPPQAYKDIKADVLAGNLTNVVPFDAPKITQYWTEIGFCMAAGGTYNPSRLDPNVRHALAMATDKAHIVDQYYVGLAAEGTTCIPPVNTYWHYEPTASEKYVYDLNAAASLLESSGYRDVNSDGIRECTADSASVKNGWVYENTPLSYNMMVRREYAEEKNIAFFLQDQWNNIGVQLTVSVMDEAELSARAYTYNYDMFIWYWSADIDPNYQLFSLSQEAWGGWSDNKWSNESYEQNYTKSVTTMDKAERKVFVDNCQRTHYLDAPYIILAYTNQTYAWRNDTFKGWGDWAADPGRSVDNFWTGNPLYFDLVPISPPNRQPGDPAVGALPDMVDVGVAVTFNASASDEDGDALHFFIDFGDGNVSEASGVAGYTDPQYAEFSHAYESSGLYDVTVWIDDGSGLPSHNVTASCEVVVNEPIPEFSSLLLPCAGAIALVLTAIRRKRRPIS